MFNWQKEISYFTSIQAHEVQRFAAIRELNQILDAYNKILLELQAGKLSENLAKLRQINLDYPMFAQASHLYGVCLAALGHYTEAGKQLKQTELLDIGERQADLLEAELAELDKILEQQAGNDRKKQRRKSLLRPVAKSLAADAILEKAGSRKEDKSVPVATAREKEAGLRQNQELAQQMKLHGELEAEEKRENRLFVATAVTICLVVFTLFYLLIRPSIMNREATFRDYSNKVEWLERELQQRAAESKDIEDLLREYQEWQVK